MSVTNLLSWTSDKGGKYSLLIVEDDEMHGNELGSMKLELCKFNSDDEAWETKEVLDSIDEIESFGIPPGYSP